ncbi:MULTISPECIES: DUF4062 domain-containing protein [unclassified Kribbella]|uniref:DUF4062 domain-containing protein n=1 Tax=unclassified Kribbella TaxID=2644121 RepID=UPI003018F44F
MVGSLIRTPDQRLRVFVSSTLAELSEERAAVRETVERLHLAPVMFELGARPYPPRDLYRAYLEQSQIFVGIYWQSYGWVAPSETVSGLEDEYSLSQGLPRLLYVKTPAPQRETRLDQLLQRIRDDDTASYKPFRSPDELARLVGEDLALLLSERFATPNLPTGVVTFLVAAAGGSAQSLAGDDKTGAIAKLHDVLRRATTSNGGYMFNSVGVSVGAAFAEPLAAVSAAFDLERALASAEWGELEPPVVRVALHSGVAEVRDNGYFGASLERAARLLTAGHGGQVLVSSAVVDLLGETPPPPLKLRSLGVHRLSDLGRAEEIQQLVMPGVRSDFPPLRTLNRRRHNLPVQLSSFVGRDRELADVKRALDTGRLVTLTGVGGSGKSRLALQAAADLVDDFPDGAWLVELAPLTEAERMPSAIANVLAIPENPRRPFVETLADELQSKRLLIVLDNCEHLLAATADLTASLLQATHGLRILATSREGMAVPGEVIIAVPSLPVPTDGTDVTDLADFPAIRLFAERAQAVNPGFAVTPANAAAVAHTVRRLDGIPLAIELAAARVKVLSLEQIASRLSDRFRLLSSGARTALPRQQTLRAAMDWSYDLLTPAEQKLLRRLSVFMGSWTIDAAETVCGGDGVDAADVLDLLGRLVDKSLVVVVEGTDENRYRLLQTVRQYARERLIDADETDVVRTGHRDWGCSIVEAAASHIRGGEEQARWLDRLESEHDDIQAALEWSLSQRDANTSLRIAVGAAWFWYLHGHWDEARRSLEQSIRLGGAEPALRAKAGAWTAIFAWKQEDLARARELAKASMDELSGGGDEGEGLTLLALALVAISRTQLEQADEYARRALSVFRAQQHTWGVTTSLLVLAHIARNRQTGDVTALLRESADLLASGLDNWGRAHVLNLQGYEALRRLDLDLAKDLHLASHALAKELGDRAGQAENLLALGHIHLLRGENEDATRVLGESRSLVEKLNDFHQLAHTDQALALLAVSRGSVADGDALLADIATRFVEMGRAPMGGAYAIGLADIYRHGGRPTLAAVLLRHALSLLDESQNPAEYARARQELAALEGSATDVGKGQQIRS